jgi:hypothetical protein
MHLIRETHPVLEKIMLLSVVAVLALDFSVFQLLLPALDMRAAMLRFLS